MPPPPPGNRPPPPQGTTNNPTATAASASGVPPPPPKRNIPPFNYTEEDVEEAALELVSGLPAPTPVASKGDKVAIGVVGPKGGKTIASIAIKTSECGGLPYPDGSRAVVLHLDNQALGSFDNFLHDTGIKVMEPDRLHFIGLGEPRGSYKARRHRSTPACSAYVRDTILRVITKLGERGDVGLIVSDGYGDLCKQYGGYVAAYESNVESPIQLEGTKWYPRREMFSDMMTQTRAAVIPGGFAVFNFPEGGIDADREAASDAKKMAMLTRRLKKEGFTSRDPPSKEIMYRENNENLSAIIVTGIGASNDGTPTYVATVWEGRLSRIGFRTGASIDITNTNIGAFCDAERNRQEQLAASPTLPPSPLAPQQTGA